MGRPRKGAQLLPESCIEDLETLRNSSLEVNRKEIFQKTIEYYLQKTQNVHNIPPKISREKRKLKPSQYNIELRNGLAKNTKMRPLGLP
jgi:hypothetical protein